MNLLQKLSADKSTIIALHMIVRNAAKEFDIFLSGSLKDVCESGGVNRTEVYEKANALTHQLQDVEVRGRGRPAAATVVANEQSLAHLEVKVAVLKYQVGHFGSVVRHGSGRTAYSDGFRRFVLECLDDWSGSDEGFCTAAEIPYHTLRNWKAIDQRSPKPPPPPRRIEPCWPHEPSETCRTIVMDFEKWEGTTRDFLVHEAKYLGISPRNIISVLRITKMISASEEKPPRYRGTTLCATPGTIVVTDGKEVKVELTATGEAQKLNWQGIVDQATACHTATVVTETERAAGVVKAYNETTTFLGRPPDVLIHDNKPIHKEEKLRATICEHTTMIPATEKRPENKAVIEGEFGKFEQHFGSVKLDDTDQKSLIKSTVSEIIRAYTAGINHAGRYEFGGKSRHEVVRNSRPDPEKDKAIIEHLKATHQSPRPADPLPSKPVARSLIDAGFDSIGLGHTSNQLREWLSDRFEPEAIRQALAIFGGKREAGALRGKHTERYFVKVLQGCQNEISLRREEGLLLKFAETESQAWLRELDREFETVKTESENDDSLARNLAEHALFGSIMIERSYWQSKLTELLTTLTSHAHRKICTHIRRVYEADWNDRFQLMSRIVSSQYSLAHATVR